MASLFNMPRPRGRKNDPDNLLGLNGDIGMTDSSFQGMGRAPVDELWAGRFSADIDDDDFDERAQYAGDLRQAAIDVKQERYLDGQPEFNRLPQERQWEKDARVLIADETGLDLYPGHLNTKVENPVFMQEFSDADAKFKEGAFERMAEGGGHLLGDVFDHPELYRHYPEAQALPLSYRDLGDDSLLGSYLPAAAFASNFKEGDPSLEVNQGVISLNSSINDPAKQRETLLHELQHYIQGIEGWQNGGSPSAELGLAYADAMEGKVDPTSPRAQVISELPAKIKEQSGEVMPFMQREAMAQTLSYPAYKNLTGEQLARDATARDEAGMQVDYYYDGPTDGNEYGNWHPEEATNVPLAGAINARKMLQDEGLLGIVDWGKEEVVKGTEWEKDPYLDQYKSLFNL